MKFRTEVKKATAKVNAELESVRNHSSRFGLKSPMVRKIVDNSKIAKQINFVVTENGTQKWFVNGKLHNQFGPAVITKDGEKNYYLYGQKYNKIGFKNKFSKERYKNCINEISN
jgi:hypothetical protein